MSEDGVMLDLASHLRRRLSGWFSDPTTSGAEPWRRTVAVLAAGLFLTFVGLGFMTPFIPLYLQELGVSDPAAIPIWSGAMIAVSSLGFGVSAPLWGMVADRFGRKPMVLRAMGMGGLATLAAAFVGSAPQLLALRIVHGLVIGPATAAFALASSTVPPDRLVRALGLLQVSLLAGQMIGPLLGGIAADTIGLRAALVVGGVLQMVGALLVGLLVAENFQRREAAAPGDPPARPRESLLHVIKSPVFLAAAGGAIAMQAAAQGTLPVLALYVQALGETDRVSTFTGLVQAGFSAGAAFGALMAGRLADRYPMGRVASLGMLGVALMLLPQAFVPSVWALIGARAAQGVCTGVISPSIQSLVARGTPAARRGTVYGLMGSASGAGSTAGPVITGALAGLAGLPSAFIAAAAFAAAGSGWLAWRLRSIGRRDTVPAG